MNSDLSSNTTVMTCVGEISGDIFDYIDNFIQDNWKIDVHTFTDYWYIIGQWNTYEEDISQLSIEFPLITFRMESVGEDNEDWIVIYKNGREC